MHVPPQNKPLLQHVVLVQANGISPALFAAHAVRVKWVLGQHRSPCTFHALLKLSFQPGYTARTVHKRKIVLNYLYWGACNEASLTGAPAAGFAHPKPTRNAHDPDEHGVSKLHVPVKGTQRQVTCEGVFPQLLGHTTAMNHCYQESCSLAIAGITV